MSEQNPVETQDSSIQILSVSECSYIIQKNLEQVNQLWVCGELSGVFIAQSGHVYATLKDQTSQLKIVIYKGVASKFPFTPENGLSVNVLASLSLYKPRGDFQLIVKALEPAGLGSLKLAFDQLKEKLLREGLFEQEKKKNLPSYPNSIGIITSPGASVLQDMMRVLMHRYPVVPVVLYPAAVQGRDAPGQLVAALEQASKEHKCDVYIIARGGGSLEDLWSFNTESVVRAVADFPYPIVSGVGHETDTTLTDFVADLRAATPSVAAHTVVPDLLDLYRFLNRAQASLQRSMVSCYNVKEQSLDYCTRVLKKPPMLEQYEVSNRLLLERLRRAFNDPSERLNMLVKQLSDDVIQAKVVLLETKIEGIRRFTLNHMKSVLKEKIFLFGQVTHALKGSYRYIGRALEQSEHVILSSLKSLSMRINQSCLALDQRTQLLTVQLKHQDPMLPYNKAPFVLKDKKGLILESAKTIKPHSKGVLSFKDGTWEVEFIKELT